MAHAESRCGYHRIIVVHCTAAQDGWPAGQYSVQDQTWKTDDSSPARAAGWEGDGQRHTALAEELRAAGAAYVQHGR